MNTKNIIFVLLTATIATSGFGQFTSVLTGPFQEKMLEHFEKEGRNPCDADTKTLEELLNNSIEAMLTLYVASAEKFKFQDNSLEEYEKEICEASIHMLHETTENSAESFIKKIKKFALHAQKESEISKRDLAGFLGLSISMALNLAAPEKYSKAQFLTLQKVRQIFSEKLNEFFIKEFGDIIPGLQKEAAATAA